MPAVAAPPRPARSPLTPPPPKAAYLYIIGEPVYASVLLGLIIPQMALQGVYLIPDPVNNDVKYQGAAQPFLVGGILTTALAVGHHTF